MCRSHLVSHALPGAPAARRLNMSTGAIRRHLQELEKWNGQQFFRRTTRSMSLTEVGSKHLEKANLILESLGDFQNVEHGEEQGLTGTIKLTASMSILR